MRRLAIVAVILGMAGVAHAEGPPAHPFGLGLMVGEPFGLSAKYYIGNKMAIDGGLGEVNDRWNDDGIHIHADVLWHPAILTDQPAFTIPFYVGVGGRFLDHENRNYNNNGDLIWEDDDVHLGARVPFGVLMDFKKVSLDVFFELAMVVDLLVLEDDLNVDEHDRVHLHAALGVRYYF